MLDTDPGFIAFCFLWFIVLGASIGSFLNVIVHRLPRGKSIVHPPSHCPHCKHLIRWYDNIPVIGWIHLRGKCRNCRLPISVRYPCVEGVCGILFGGFFVLFGQFGDISIIHRGSLTLLCASLGTCILAFCLIAYDRGKR